MNEVIKELAIAITGVIFAKALDEAVEVLKKKTSCKQGKHTKRS